MGHWADLPDGDLWGPPLRKPFLKCGIVTKSDEGTMTGPVPARAVSAEAMGAGSSLREKTETHRAER